MSNDKICIYCGNTDKGRFCGIEHVIPQGFGRFGSETPTLDCVCDDCNRYFGRELDQLLTRETPEGIARYRYGQFSKEARPQQRVVLTLADPNEVGAFQGFRVAVDGTTGELMPPAPQFHIHNFKTGGEEVYFIQNIDGLSLPESKYGKPGTSGQKGTWRCKILAPTREAHDVMVKKLQSAGIDFKPGTAIQNPWDVATEAASSFLVEITSEIDKSHRRAIAKVLMNFIAFYLGLEEALKSRWDPIRRYIRKGEGEIKARLSDQPFLKGVATEGFPLPENCISICIGNLDGNIVGAIQFYRVYTLEMILVENDNLCPAEEKWYRYIRGEIPIEVTMRRQG